ncbi:hypothetical protein DMN91_012207 [Ooceraea biroi]|uniref:SAP domain-containing protein n=1 Tax=Ooceraea biroi TaxID=2015173 RepID=A0A3L8D5C4_OOCBI|nr:hypothetical protein DMN91_012207 [Ooceraea biroi]
MLRDRGLSTVGNKADLLLRLRQNDPEALDAGVGNDSVGEEVHVVEEDATDRPGTSGNTAHEEDLTLARQKMLEVVPQVNTAAI